MPKKNDPKTKGICLQDMSLLALEFVVNPEYNVEKLKVPDLTADYCYGKSKIGRKNILTCKINLMLSSPKKEDPFKLMATYQWEYSYTKDSEMNIDKFAREVAPAHIISYFRELVSNITNRTHYPVLNLPLINILRLLPKESIKKLEVKK